MPWTPPWSSRQREPSVGNSASRHWCSIPQGAASLLVTTRFVRPRCRRHMPQYSPYKTPAVTPAAGVSSRARSWSQESHARCVRVPRSQQGCAESSSRWRTIASDASDPATTWARTQDSTMSSRSSRERVPSGREWSTNDRSEHLSSCLEPSKAAVRSRGRVLFESLDRSQRVRGRRRMLCSMEPRQQHDRDAEGECEQHQCGDLHRVGPVVRPEP